MPDQRIVTFGPFRLDLGAEQLWHGDAAVPLTARAFAVLRYLVEHAGQLVLRHALLEAVWGTLYVSDAALASCIRDIRRALHDQAHQPQCLETVRGRGFRFIAPVTEFLPQPSPRVFTLSPQATGRSPALLVGREAELRQLHQWYALARQGVRQLVFVTGEAGMGKTALVDAFASQVMEQGVAWLGRGQCIEHHGTGEAYLPLLEALAQLGQTPDGTSLMALLHQYAPSWLLHLPALVPAAQMEALQQRASGTTRERMLREFAEAVEALTVERPLVLVLEDLHWSDSATLDWLAYVARRRTVARLLVLGTYRSVEAIARAHPVRLVVQELQVHDQCAELLLEYLSAAEVEAYLTQRGGGWPVPAGLTPVLHQRTNGNPLFLVTLVETLVRQGVLREGATGWELLGSLEAAVGVPESLRQLITQQVEQLPVADQELLEAASVAGMECATAAVAAAVGRTVDEVEARCAALARRGQFLRVCGVDEWPDGTVATRYGFIHDLYRETVYDRLPAG
jgi:predicted ATPase/DNA-binding winged helix-turn-helix (wHTH) protein